MDIKEEKKNYIHIQKYLVKGIIYLSISMNRERVSARNHSALAAVLYACLGNSVKVWAVELPSLVMYPTMGPGGA